MQRPGERGEVVQRRASEVQVPGVDEDGAVRATRGLHDAPRRVEIGRVRAGAELERPDEPVLGRFVAHACERGGKVVECDPLRPDEQHVRQARAQRVGRLVEQPARRLLEVLRARVVGSDPFDDGVDVVHDDVVVVEHRPQLGDGRAGGERASEVGLGPQREAAHAGARGGRDQLAERRVPERRARDDEVVRTERQRSHGRSSCAGQARLKQVFELLSSACQARSTTSATRSTPLAPTTGTG